jgi:hypothetical protein
MEKDFISLKIVLLTQSNNGVSIIKDNNTARPKHFVFKTDDAFIALILKEKNIKEALNYNLVANRYFWEWLEDIDLFDSVRILNIDFTYKEKEYSFAYLSEDDIDQNWIDVKLYNEEFGEHSDFDLYQTYFGFDEKNKEYFF